VHGWKHKERIDVEFCHLTLQVYCHGGYMGKHLGKRIDIRLRPPAGAVKNGERV
jgi:hypothetical protein